MLEIVNSSYIDAFFIVFGCLIAVAVFNLTYNILNIHKHRHLMDEFIKHSVNIKEETEEKKENSTPQIAYRPTLTADECNKLIEDIIMDIYANKYLVNYRLRDVVVIPNMDQEITTCTKEVVESIGENVMIEALRYYSYEYIIARITRKITVLFIEYTQTYKPNTK